MFLLAEIKLVYIQYIQNILQYDVIFWSIM